MPCTYISCVAERHMGRESMGTLIQAKMPEEGETLLSRFGGQVQTIYLDPPFNTGKQFDMKVRIGEGGYKNGSPSLNLPAYDDRWPDRTEYLAMMKKTLLLSRELLKKEGTIFLHIDSRMYAHLRLLMDEVFGESNFLNEIIWSYQTGGRARSYFPRKHDVILFYARSRSYYFNLKAVPVARNESRSNHMRRAVDENGRSYRAIMSGGKEYRYYDDEPAYPGDVWDDISHLQQKDPQRTGYETQKPLKLLERIVSCSSQEGDLICDLFAGSGTFAVECLEGIVRWRLRRRANGWRRARRASRWISPSTWKRRAARTTARWKRRSFRRSVRTQCGSSALKMKLRRLRASAVWTPWINGAVGLCRAIRIGPVPRACAAWRLRRWPRRWKCPSARVSRAS